MANSNKQEDQQRTDSKKAVPKEQTELTDARLKKVNGGDTGIDADNPGWDPRGPL